MDELTPKAIADAREWCVNAYQRWPDIMRTILALIAERAHAEAERLEALEPRALSDHDATIIGADAHNVVYTHMVHGDLDALKLGRSIIADLEADGFAIVRVAK